MREITGAAWIATDGTREALPLPTDALEWRIAVSACVQLLRPFDGRGIALQLVVGIADDWDSLPASLRHGVIRLAAHLYRERDRDGKAGAAVPASVTALWRPWRSTRLA